jgi:hypothetical protein
VTACVTDPIRNQVIALKDADSLLVVCAHRPVRVLYEYGERCQEP